MGKLLVAGLFLVVLGTMAWISGASAGTPTYYCKNRDHKGENDQTKRCGVVFNEECAPLNCYYHYILQRPLCQALSRHDETERRFKKCCEDAGYDYGFYPE